MILLKCIKHLYIFKYICVVLACASMPFIACSVWLSGCCYVAKTVLGVFLSVAHLGFWVVSGPGQKCPGIYHYHLFPG